MTINIKVEDCADCPYNRPYSLFDDSPYCTAADRVIPFTIGPVHWSGRLPACVVVKTVRPGIAEFCPFKVCKTCQGTGRINDAEPGDIEFNEAKCPDCEETK